MDFIGLAAEIEERYRRYLRTTFYFRDPELRASFHRALEQGRLAKGPYLEATPAYRRGRPPDELFPEIIGRTLELGFLAALDGARRLYRHQEEAIRRVAAGRNIVVATGTGSGKTECFLYPILMRLYQEFAARTLSGRAGVRALVLYPMNALAYDQRDRLGRLHERLNQEGAAFRFKFGQYTGATPENARDTYRHAADVLAHRCPGELAFREEMRQSPPHILLTNYSMLEYLLLRPSDTPLFDGAHGRTWTFLVIDEAHQYRGTKGSEMALLLRRLKQRLRESGNEGAFRCIATSATLARGGGDRAAVASFAGKLFDERFDSDDVILADTEDFPETTADTLPATAYQALRRAIEKDDPELIGELDPVFREQDANAEPATVAVRVGQCLARDRRTAVFRGLVAQGPRGISELADALFPEVDARDRNVALASFAEVLNRAEQPFSAGPFLSVRYHLFLRALEGAYARYLPGQSITLSPQGRTAEDGLSFELALCRECGQHYLVGQRVDGRFAEAVRDPSRDDFGVSFFRPISSDDQDIDEDIGPALKRFNLCTRCGAFGAWPNPPPCQHRVHLVVEEQEQPKERRDQMAQCTACGYRGEDPVREVIHGGDGPHAMIATTLFERLDQDPKKILAFADSRQEAAYFAWYLDDTYKSILRRNLLCRSIRDTGGRDGEPLSLADLADAHRRRCLRDGLIGEAASRREQWQKVWEDVYREFLTPETRLSLSGVGLVRWSARWPAGLEPADMLAQTPWNLTREDALTITFLLLDSLRRDRAVELDTRDNVELDWSGLGLFGSQRFARLGPPHKQSQVVSWNGPQGWRVHFLAKILERQGQPHTQARQIADQTLRSIWERLTRFSDIQPSAERLLIRVNDGRRLNPVWWRVEPLTDAHHLYRCDTCNRLETLSFDGVCPRRGCSGRLGSTDIAAIADNHYRMLYQGGLRGKLEVEEHTAQLATERGREIQREFQEGHIHVLSCSTTFELGVDLGDLNTVFLRNVPPEPFNYVQRVGRAGRRAGSPGFAVTYCRRGPHDLYHFADPARLLSGRTKPPAISLENSRVAERHLTAVALSGFFRTEPGRFERVSALIGDWSAPTFLSAVAAHLRDHQHHFVASLRAVFPPRVASDLGLDDGSWIERIAGSDSRLARAEIEVASDYRRIDELEERERQARRYSQADWARRRKQTIAEEDVLSFLSRKAVIPKYGFPVDVVELDTQRIGTQQASNVSLSRDLAIAIGEFAPTATLVASKREWQSYGLKKVPEREWERKNYKVCRRHNVMVTWNNGDAIPDLPCGDPAQQRTYVIPTFGFVTSTKPPGTPTHRPLRMFTTRPYFLESRGTSPEAIDVSGNDGPIATIWKAVPGRMAVLSEGRKAGQFYICGSCGAGFLDMTSAANHKTPWNIDCAGSAARLSLGHEFVTDVVQIQFHMSPGPQDATEDPAWLGYGVATALLEGMAEVIDVPTTDLNVTIGRGGEGLPAIVLYDDVPGGAGLVARIEDLEVFRASLEAAHRRVQGSCECGEDTSCYGSQELPQPVRPYAPQAWAGNALPAPGTGPNMSG